MRVSETMAEVMHRLLNRASGLWVGLVLVAIHCPAEDFRLESVGARYGFYPNGSRGDFRQAEGYGNFQLPWVWNITTNWNLRPRLDLSAGVLSRYRQHGLVATAGPSLVLSRKGWPFALVAGSSPTILSREEFVDADFGVPVQFTSHLGLYWQPGSHFELSYRFQHMSNAGLGSQNPGLNLHMFGVGYRF